jgi:RNA polymerase sigma factor (sigma-70 family)
LTATTLTGVDAEAQFAELLERHRGIVFKVAATYCRNPADREDVAQEIVTQLWRAFPTYDAARTFSTWMYRIALNVAISFVRTNSVRARHTVALDETHDVEDPTIAEADETARLLYSFIDRLDALNRALLLLYLDEHSYRDIAAILGITETNVATKISRLKQRFAREAALALGVLITLAVGPFWWSHRAEPGLLVSGLVLHLYAVLMIALGTRVIVLIRTLQLDAPVVQIQKALANLRRSYLLTGFVVGMPWWLLWIPLTSVVFGFDPVVDVPRSWLVTNLVVGVVGILGTLWFFRALWTAPADSERRRGAEDSVAGRSFKSAQGFLDEIARFERE